MYNGIYVIYNGNLVLFVCFVEDGIKKHIWKWSDMSLLKMAVSKTVSVKEFLRIWPIAFVAFCVTAFGLFIVGIIPFL